jgi:nicotinamide-nucleotide amidase
VSGETAAAMAKGALKRSGADCAVSITGIAGPSGGSNAKPVGLVHFAAVRRNGKMLAKRRLFGNVGRERVRELSALEALALLAKLADKSATRQPT